MELTCFPLIYSSTVPTKANQVFAQHIKQQSPHLFTQEKKELYESFHRSWTSPTLGIGHTCGSNFTQEYSEYLSILGTPIFGALGCEGKYYKSALLIHRKHRNLNTLHDVINHFDKLILAVNYFGSNSGWFLFISALARYCEQHSLETLSNLSSILQTGSHNANILAILSGEAHLTSVDCISLALMQKHHPELVKDVKIIGWTEKGLTPPFVTSRKHSLDLQKQLQECLLEAVTTSKDDVLKARQDLLLIGVQLNDHQSQADLAEEYFQIINKHKDLACRYFPFLTERLKPGRLLREHQSLSRSPHHPLGRGLEGAERAVVMVYSKGRSDDQHWPVADFQFQNYLRSFFLSFCLEQIVDSCLAQSGLEQQWQEETLLAAIQRLVGREIWAPLPLGGSAKIIICSWQGIVHLLSLSDPARGASEAAAGEEEEAEEVQSNSRSYNNDSSYRLISSTVDASWQRKIFSLARSLFVSQVLPSLGLSPSEQKNKEEEVEELKKKAQTVCFSGFMGCASREVIDYFDSPSSSSSGPSLLSELWAIDLALSEKLLEIGASIGIYVYISAPRHNDRCDWGNLVLGRDNAAILRWRDSLSHSSARKYIAPRAYEHIRIHRGAVVAGLGQTHSLQLQQTTFLQPKLIPAASLPKAAAVDNPSLLGGNLGDQQAYDRLFESHEPQNQQSPAILEELNRLMNTQSHVLNASPSGGSGSYSYSYDPEKTQYYFKRRVVHWKREEVEKLATKERGKGQDLADPEKKPEVETAASTIVREDEDEDDLIPNVKGSTKTWFARDLLDMQLVVE